MIRMRLNIKLMLVINTEQMVRFSFIFLYVHWFTFCVNTREIHSLVKVRIDPNKNTKTWHITENNKNVSITVTVTNFYLLFYILIII